jgi:hypothetical protein
MSDKPQTLASVVNMRAYVNVPGIVAWSSGTGEEYSATAEDYWGLDEEETLTDSEGEPMVLVSRVIVYRDVADVAGEVFS